MDIAKRVYKVMAPAASKGDDGRDMWPSRLAFIFASMGGAIGLGNLLRYPSVVFANSGLQWFIPYLIALCVIAIPVLTLEIAAGQTYRTGTVGAFNKIHKRLKGVGLAVIFNGYFVVVYYVPIIAWIMHYFQDSFKSPLPWAEDGNDYYRNVVIANPPPSPPVYENEDGSGKVLEYANYAATGLIGPTAGWVTFVWFVVWLCMFKGVGLTGRVVYFTIGIPIVTVIILMGRSLSLSNAKAGVELYFAEWHGSKLSDGAIWQAAAGQIFFSIGVGFGYFTSYASYNAKHSNAVQDSLIIAFSNSLFEVISAFAVFGVIGHLNLEPDTALGTFTVAFLTYPQAIAQMAGSNFWAVLFFSTIFLLGISSAFALLEAIVTMCLDTSWGSKISRPVMCTAWVVVSWALSLMYCTEFGFYLLDAVDTYVNNCSLLFIVWCECVLPTMLYRYQDVVTEVGYLPWVIYNFGHIGGQFIGVGIAHGVDPAIGAIVGFSIYIVFSIVSVLMADSSKSFLGRLWWLALYSGEQLRRDLNVIIGQGKNWNIPVFWAPVLRYVSSPVLAMIFGFSYNLFYKNRGDPLHIFAFSAAHVIMLTSLIAIAIPSWLNFCVAPAMVDSDKLQYATAPGVTLDDTDAINRPVQDPMDMEVGLEGSSGVSQTKEVVEK